MVKFTNYSNDPYTGRPQPRRPSTTRLRSIADMVETLKIKA